MVGRVGRNNNITAQRRVVEARRAALAKAKAEITRIKRARALVRRRNQMRRKTRRVLP